LISVVDFTNNDEYYDENYIFIQLKFMQTHIMFDTESEKWL